MIHLVAVLALLMYLLSSILFLAAVSLGRQVTLGPASLSLRAGFGLHTLAIALIFLMERPILLESRADYFFWLAWIVPLAYFTLRRRMSFPIVGAFVSSASLLFWTSSSYLVHQVSAPARAAAEPGSALSNAALLGLHALPALLAEASLVLAFIVSSVFILQSRRLKSKSLDTLSFRGPSLDSLESLNHRFVLTGFIAMTLAVLSGSVWALSQRRMLLGSDLSQWSAVASWVLLAVILHSRLTLRWSALRLSRVTVWVTGVFVVSFFLMVLLSGTAMHNAYF